MLQWRVLVLLVLVAQGRASPLPSAPASAPSAKEDVIYKLPPDNRIVPSHYEIHLTPGYIVETKLNDIEEFTGNVVIRADVATNLKEIYLNCDKAITITHIHIFGTREVTSTTSNPTTTSDTTTSDTTTSGTTTSETTTSETTTTPTTTSETTTSETTPTTTSETTTSETTTTPTTTSETTTSETTTTPTTTTPTTTSETTTTPTTTSETTTTPTTTTPSDGGEPENDEGNGGGNGNGNDNPGKRQKRNVPEILLPTDESWEELEIKQSTRRDLDILIIEMEETISAGTPIKIVIKYSQKFKENELNGFYVSTYTDSNNDSQTVLATQFESTYARKAFPCFDEPEFKAVFDLSIDVVDGVNAIANTEGTKEGNTINFKKTPKMPTYLLAFVVYDEASFGTKQTATDTFKTYARTEALDANQQQLSQQDGPAMIQILETYTGINYYKKSDGKPSMEMSKMDQVAIPDFASGAMENWGLVTYRESALLFTPLGSQAAKKRVSQVIAHELAHQWFGNWVTTKWWNTIWLNEGFADLFEHEVMASRYSSWRMNERMVLDEQMYAFDSDSDNTSPALTLVDSEVKTPDDISNHFGTITYSKGGSILRQIRNVLGENSFKEAIQKYLQKKEFESATPEELFVEFQEKNNDDTLLSKEDLRDVLENWTKKPGYPVITVVKDGNKIKLSQSRFLFSTNKNDDKTNYDVYLTWMTNLDDGKPSSPPRPQEWIRSSENGEKEITIEGDWSWVLLNIYQGGYYRVDYSKALWNALKSGLSDHSQLEKVAPLDRAALINNALSLVRDRATRNMEYDEVFSFLLFLKHDFDFAPWAALRYSLGHVIRMMGNTAVYRNFIRNIVENAYNKLTPNTLSSTDSNNVEVTKHVNIMTVACGGNYGPCLEWAEQKLKAYFATTNPTDVQVDLQPIAYCYGLKNAPELWDKLWEKYEAARKDMTRRQLIASALGCVKNEDTLRKYLDNSVNKSIDIPDSERYLAFSAVYANLDGGPKVALQFIKDKGVDTLAKEYGGVSRMKSLLNGLAGYLWDDADKQTLKAAVAGKSQYEGCVDIVENNAEWRQKNEEKINEGLTRASASAMSLATGLVLLCAAVLRYFR